MQLNPAQSLKNTVQPEKTAADSVRLPQLWNPMSSAAWANKNLNLMMNEPVISLNAPIKKSRIPYYDLRSVFPANPLLLDYRHHSYYTPKVVSDYITHTMNRPPADSFMPWPTVALLAASVALQYAEIGQRIKITSRDYLVDEKYHPVLLALWNEAPQTAADVYRSVQNEMETTAGRVREDLQHLAERRLVKVKQIEKEATRYYPALSGEAAALLFKNAYLDEALTSGQLIIIAKLKDKIINPTGE